MKDRPITTWADVELEYRLAAEELGVDIEAYVEEGRKAWQAGERFSEALERNRYQSTRDRSQARSGSTIN